MKKSNNLQKSIIHEQNFITDPLSINNVVNKFFSTVALQMGFLTT